MNILRIVHICGQDTFFLLTEDKTHNLTAPLIYGLWLRFPNCDVTNLLF